MDKPRHTGRLPDFPWLARRIAGRYRNVGDPWTLGIGDAIRWKLGLGAASSAPRPALRNAAVELVAPNRALIHPCAPEQLAATWIGHATFLLQR